MTAVHYTVRTMKLTFDADVVGYECAITGVTEAESHDEVTGATACPDGVFTDVGPSRWSIQIDYNVDHAVGSLHRLLRDRAGEACTITLEPDPVVYPGLSIDYDVPALVGSGAAMPVGSTATSSVTLGLNGQPVYTDPPLSDAFYDVDAA